MQRIQLFMTVLIAITIAINPLIHVFTACSEEGSNKLILSTSCHKWFYE